MKNTFATADRTTVKQMNLESYLKGIVVKLEVPESDEMEESQSIPESVITAALRSTEKSAIEFIDDLIEAVHLELGFHVKELSIEEEKLQPLL
ncbi:MAG: hypothetical protein CL760_09695 [Chloroflexi bacterium]|nr:hypothetical protein [Chloroflexota bacterium]|tara:strand:- start:8512 stop:8790 length:279 start_codon:yes stop_codon:yes gene_type:complete